MPNIKQVDITNLALLTFVCIYLHLGTGDVVVDMESQVKANSMRIMVLEEQNGALRNSIAKVLETQKRGPKEVMKSFISRSLCGRIFSKSVFR